MTRCSAWREARPGLWLGAALAADAAIYASASERQVAVIPWLVLDLWLAVRIWKRGPIALALFRFLQALGTSLFGLVLVLSQWDDRAATTAGPGTVALFALSTWCLFAPALSGHVTGRRRAVQPSVTA